MNRYLAATLAVLAFVAAQAFQEPTYHLWIPAARGPAAELGNYLLPVDEVRAMLIGATVLLLLVPYVVVALRYFHAAPVASVLGLIFGTGFVAAETVHRSLDFFMVGGWARQFQASDETRDVIVQRYQLWIDISHAMVLSFAAGGAAGVVLLCVGDLERHREGWMVLAGADSVSAERLSRPGAHVEHVRAPNLARQAE
jgi:hypothetical protein